MPKDVEIGFFIAFTGDSVPDGYSNKFFAIKGKEPIRYVTGDSNTEFTAVLTGAHSGFKNIDILEPDFGHVYGLDWGIEQDVKVFLKIPTGNDRLGLDRDMDVGYITNIDNPAISPNPEFEFWVTEDMYPAFDVENITPVTITPKIWFKGFKYEIEEVQGELAGRLASYAANRGGQPFQYIVLGGANR